MANHISVKRTFKTRIGYKNVTALRLNQAMTSGVVRDEKPNFPQITRGSFGYILLYRNASFTSITSRHL